MDDGHRVRRVIFSIARIDEFPAALVVLASSSENLNVGGTSLPYRR